MKKLRRVIPSTVLFFIVHFIRAQCTPTINVIPPTCTQPGGYQIIVPSTCTNASAATPYFLIWGVPSGCQTPTLLTIPGPGTYSNYFTSGCSTIYNVSVFDNNFNPIGGNNANGAPAAPATLTFVVGAAIQPSCNGMCNGQRMIYWQGSGPLTVSLSATSPGSPGGIASSVFTNVPAFTTQTITGLCAGTHTLSALDANGCTYTGMTFTLGQPTAVSASTILSNITCFGSTNGAFSVSPTGGTPGYTVNFNPGGVVTTTTGGTASVGSLSAGVITATVSDSKNCTFTAAATVTQPTSITANINSGSLTCGGVCNGTAAVTISGGGTTYSVSWNGGTSSTSLSTGSLCAGNQTATITDNLNCVVTRTFSITAPPTLTANITVTGAVCNSVCNGSGTLVPSGGTGTNSIQWLNAGNNVVSTSTLASNLCAGTYSVHLTDQSGCQFNQTVSISQPPAVTLNVVTQSITCQTNTAGGSATANISGGNGGPFTFTWTGTGGTTVSTSSLATGLPAGNYTLIARDALSCQISTVISILQPATYTYAVTSNSLLCSNLCNGSMTVTPIGGTGPYQYTLQAASGSTNSTAGTFTALCGGNYTLITKDAVSTCPQQTIITLAAPLTLTASVATTSLACFNVCNGALAGSATGGTGPYSFTWTTGAGTQTGSALTGRCAGGYTLLVRDANTCTAQTTASLSQPAQMSITVNTTQESCFNSCNGILAANPSGGTPGYTVNWSNAFSGLVNNGLCSGAYSYTLTDANGCSLPGTSTLQPKTPVTVGIGTTGIICAGNCNGSATLTPAGGNAPYSFTLSGSPTANNTTGLFTNLCSGAFIANVSDANGCTTSSNVTIPTPSLLSIAVVGTKNSCLACTGAGTVAASGGVPGFNYSWTNSTASVVSTASTAANLCTGNYTVSVTDNSGCTATTTLAINQTIIGAVVNGGTGISCNGLCTGSAVVSPSGGSGSYTYSWSTTPAQTSATATALCAGVYTVTVNELGGAGCTATNTIGVTQPASITINSSITNVQCNGLCNGAITPTLTGGAGGFTYTWTPGLINTSSLTSLCSGGYTLNARDANGCSITPQTYSVSQPPAVTGNFTITAPSGCTLTNGGICASPSGGNGAPYTFTWLPGASNGSCITNVGAGLYTVTIRDAGGCTLALNPTINSNTVPIVSVNQQSANCFGGNGSATISATSGNGGPFSYTWSPAVVINTNIATNIPAGNYAVNVKDGQGCSVVHTFVINQPTSLTVIGSAVNAQCSNTLNGAVSLTVSGGSPSYGYNWTGPSFTSTLQNISGLNGGVYSVTITDANNCTKTQNYTLTVPPAITLTTVSSKTAICAGSVCNGSVAVNATGGTGSVFSYSWLPLAPFTGSSTATVLNLCAGVYTVNVNDAANCQATATFSIVASNLSASVIVKNETCGGDCNGAATLSVTGGAPGFNYSWSSGSFTTTSISALCAGNYTANVTDANGCVASNSFVIGKALLTASLSSSPVSCANGTNGAISSTITGAQGNITYNWSPGGSGPNPSSLPPGTYTLIAVDDSLCQISSVITLTNPAQLTSSINVLNPSCAAVCNGQATISVNFAVGTPSVTWSHTTTTSNTMTALCGGTAYTYTITDANGCKDVATFSLVSPPAVNVLASTFPPTCGSNNGTINITATGGTTFAPAPGYSITWTPAFVSGFNPTNLDAGIYTVSVLDGAGCTGSLVIPLSNSNGPQAPVSHTNLSCNSLCTGAASVGIISGTTPPFSLVWNLPNASTTTLNPITSLCAGVYISQITDNNQPVGCVTFSTITVTQPASISVTQTQKLPTCPGICDGSITVTPSGGAGPYTYSWSPSVSSGSTVTNLCAGTYSLIVGYNGVCAAPTITFDIPGQVNLPTPAATTTNNTCAGDCNGAISVFMPSGNLAAPFSFNWSNGQTNSGPTSASVSALCSGTYSLIVTSASGCSSTYSYQINTPNQLTITPSITQPECNHCNGSASLTIAGGTGTSYSVNWSNGGNGPVTASLCAGLYQAVITDAAGCSKSQTITINNSSGITGDSTHTANERCFAQCNGSVTIYAIGGTLPINYQWLAPAVTGNSLTGLCGGDYFVQMTDAKGCIRTASTHIGSASAMSLSPFVRPPSCGPAPFDGSISVQVTGGSPVYSYSWSPVAGSNSFVTNVGPGQYTLLVHDSSPGGGCQEKFTVNLSNLNGPVVVASQTNIACEGSNTGAITVSVVAPTGVQPVYLWSNSATANSVNSIPQGVITLTVTDNATGCKSIESYSISANPKLVIQLSKKIQACANVCNAEINVLPLGGALPYTYSWPSHNHDGPSYDSLCAGNYTVVVTDALNCATDSVVVLKAPPELKVVATFTNATCASKADGAVNISIVGGVPVFTVKWNGPGGFVSSNLNNVNLFPGNYKLIVSDSNKCKVDTTLTLAPTVTVIANAGADTTLCAGQTITLTALKSVGAISYNWYQLPDIFKPLTTQPTFVASSPETYTYLLQANASVTGCFDKDTVVVNVFELPYLDAGLSFTIPVFSTVIIGGNPTAFTPDSVLWSPSFQLDNPKALNPAFSGNKRQKYYVTMKYGKGCVAMDSLMIDLYPEIIVSSGFTPNGDGKNDRWIVDYIDQFPENTVEIFNRWGERLFYSKGYQDPWDGTFKGKALPVGTYYYIIHLNHPAYPEPYTGPVTLFR